jgi:hypothetical protein
LSQNYFFIIILSSVFIIPAYATITLQNSNFEFDDFNLNVTDPVTIDVFTKSPSGFTTNAGEDLRFFSFDNSTHPNVRWIEHTDTYANFTITDVVSNLRGNVTGSELGSIEIDQVSVTWTYTTLNIADIDNGLLVEYFFPAVTPTPTFNTIILRVNPAQNNTLGGAYAVLCPTNSTLTGLLTNGTFVCTDMSVFFP